MNTFDQTPDPTGQGPPTRALVNTQLPQFGVQQWRMIQDAYAFVQERRAMLVEGDRWRVARGPETVITITIETSRGSRRR